MARLSSARRSALRSCPLSGPVLRGGAGRSAPAPHARARLLAPGPESAPESEGDPAAVGFPEPPEGHGSRASGRYPAPPRSPGFGRAGKAAPETGPRLAPSRGEAGDLQEDRLPDGPGLCAPASERAGRGGPARARALPGATGPGYALGRPPAYGSERLRAPVRQSCGGHSRPKRTHLTQQAAHCLQAFMNKGFSAEFGAKSSTGSKPVDFEAFSGAVAKIGHAMANFGHGFSPPGGVTAPPHSSRSGLCRTSVRSPLKGAFRSP